MGYNEEWARAAGGWAGVGVLIGIGIGVLVLVVGVWILLKVFGV